MKTTPKVSKSRQEQTGASHPDREHRDDRIYDQTFDIFNTASGGKMVSFQCCCIGLEVVR